LGGGFLITILTLRAQRKKANAEAKGADALAESTELDNVTKAITIWREMAENMSKELADSRAKYDEVTSLVKKLQSSVDKLNCTNQKILKLLDKISHENLESTVAEIKNEIKKNDA
jgi:redox-regulated HSP33 family molecular chaperone